VPVVFGIDPGITNLGVALIALDGAVRVRKLRVTCEDDDGSVVSDFLRCRAMELALYTWLSENLPRVRRVVCAGRAVNDPVVCVEGPSFGRHPKGSIQAGMLHAAVHGALLRCRHAVVIVVPPTVLKKYVTGKGNASKEAMLEGILLRWFRQGAAPGFGSQDLYEAYALARLGQDAVTGTKEWLQKAIYVYQVSEDTFERIYG